MYIRVNRRRKKGRSIAISIAYPDAFAPPLSHGGADSELKKKKTVLNDESKDKEE
jgi:hypothetical protein